jgi:ABC-type glycerol-3-phosphate transport system substrate-binding protein
MNQSSSSMFSKVFIIACALLGILGIAVFAMSQFGGAVDENLTGKISIWGTLPSKDIDQHLVEYSQAAKTYTAEYTEIKEDEFINKFIKSLADDSAPDIVLVPETVLIPLRGFLQEYTNEQITEATYKNTFVKATHKLFDKNGIVSIPYAIDPLLMYVNSDISQNAGFQRPIQNWSDIPLFAKRVNELVKNVENNNQRAIAIGSINNVKESRSILLSLLLQVRNDLVERKVEWSENDKRFYEKFVSVFAGSRDEEVNQNSKAAEQVFVFFTSFINPNISEVYSWSRKYPSDRDLFAAGNLGIYFGLASDKAYIDLKNPNLKYEVAPIPVPKVDGSQVRSTGYVKVYSVGINNKTSKPILAQKVMNDFTDIKISQPITDKLNLAPAQILEIETPQKEQFKDVVYRAADRGDVVLEPKPGLFKSIFQEIITSLEGSKITPVQIIVAAQRELERQLAE